MSEHHRKLERLYVAAPVNRYYQPTIEVADGTAVIEAEARPEYWHAAGAMHGSVYFKMLDDAAFFAANSLVEDVLVLTASFNLYFLRPVSQGRIRSEGRVVSRSRRVILAEATLQDGRGRELARGSGTFMPSRTRLTPDLGYDLEP